MSKIARTTFIAVGLVAALAVGACSGTDPGTDDGGSNPPASGKPVIGATLPILDEWQTTYADGLKAAAEAAGFELRLVAAQERVDTQLGQVENFVANEVDGLIVIAVDAEATDPMTKAAADNDIPLVYVNRRPQNLPDDVAFVDDDSVMAGTLQMTELARLKGGTGKVAILQGMPGDYNTVRRTQGCTDVIAQNPGMEVVLEGTANYFRDQALAVVENWLQSGTEFDVICSNNDEMALGAILALQAAGKTLGADGVVVGGVDAPRDALGAVQDGSLAVTVFQDGPGQGAAAVDAVKKLIAGETLTDNYFDAPFQLVTPENLGDFLK